MAKEEMIEKLRLIEDDWDWRGGKKPSKKAITRAAEIVDLFDEEMKKKCAVFPSCEGGVYVLYKDENVRVNVFVRKDGKIVWFLKKGNENKVCIGSVDELKDYLKNLIGKVQ